MNIFLKKFLKSKETLGCDVGVSSLKFVGLKRGHDTFLLQSLGLFETNVLTENAVAVQRTRAYLKENDVYGRGVALNIEDKSLRIRRMDLAEMPEGDMKIAIRWNFREYVDGPIEKYLVDYLAIENLKTDDEKRPILAFGVASDAVEHFARLVKQIGLKPVTIEPNATALLAAFDLNVGWEAGKYSAMIDLGNGIANFIVVGNGSLLFSRPLAGADCNTLIKMIAKDTSSSFEDAASFFKSVTGQGGGKAKNIDSTVNSFLAMLVVEIQRSIDAFCLMFRVDKVDSVYLSGGGSLIPGITDYFAKNLGIGTRLFNPFERIDTTPAGDTIANPQLYAVAAGLAIPRA